MSKTTEWVLTPKDEELIIERAKWFKFDKMRWAAMSRNGFFVEPKTVPELTEEERTEALRAANAIQSAKLYFDGLSEAKQEKERIEKAEFVAQWGYDAFYRLMKHNSLHLHQKPLIYDYTTSKLIQCICWKFSNDSRYETDLGFSFKKGLIIRGTYGLGKSYLIGLIKDNPVNNIQIVTMPEIKSSIMACGEFRGINFRDYQTIYLDDVGKEYDQGGKVMYMGTTINWFADWLSEFYAKSPNHFYRLVLSTNDNFDLIEKKYGTHIRDRMREKFDVIDLTGESMRK